MARIEDYAVIGNCETIALVGRDGSIDWLGLPRFDSPACFAALLGDASHGRWLIASGPAGSRITRRYRGDTLILETRFETDDFSVCVIDFMSRRDGVSDVVRLVRGLRGTSPMRMELAVRFEYGSVIPWVIRAEDGRLQLAAGAERLLLDTKVALRGEGFRTLADFDVAAGEEIGFTLSWTPSYRPMPAPLAAAEALAQVEKFWADWTSAFKPIAAFGAPVLRSLLTLKALAHWQTGGIVAAGTTSLPEKIGGTRNWDYRYCWLRDSTLVLYALARSGFIGEAGAWREWLLRAVAGSPDKLQTIYGVAGERRLAEYEISSLPGYEGSRPVRIGNAASAQVQLDIYGELLASFYVARKAGLSGDAESWALECALAAHLETIWAQPDSGIWEVRGPPRHFVHSKVMAWVAFDSLLRSAEAFGLEGPVDRWREVRDRIHREVCEHGFNRARNSFVQAYDLPVLDASLLLIPVVGFLPITDPRVRSTVAAIEADLLHEGFVYRYQTRGQTTDGLPPGEGAFLACTLWLADTYAMQGRRSEACALFERVLSLCNDVGLLAEEYDPVAKRQLGNFPQAFSHLALINTARRLAENDTGPHDP